MLSNIIGKRFHYLYSKVLKVISCSAVLLFDERIAFPAAVFDPHHHLVMDFSTSSLFGYYLKKYAGLSFGQFSEQKGYCSKKANDKKDNINTCWVGIASFGDRGV